VWIMILGEAWEVKAQDAKSPYPNMAPLEQYLMERDAEIALARSAAPSPFHGTLRSWSLDGMATKLRSRARIVSCARWNDRGVLESTTRFLESQAAGSDLLQPAGRAI